MIAHFIVCLIYVPYLIRGPFVLCVNVGNSQQLYQPDVLVLGSWINFFVC